MGYPIVVLLLGLVLSLAGHIWVWPVGVAFAAVIAILVLVKDFGGKEKRALTGIALTIFFSGLVLFAAGVAAVYMA